MCEYMFVCINGWKISAHIVLEKIENFYYDMLEYCIKKVILYIKCQIYSINSQYRAKMVWYNIFT